MALIVMQAAACPDQCHAEGRCAGAAFCNSLIEGLPCMEFALRVDKSLSMTFLMDIFNKVQKTIRTTAYTTSFLFFKTKGVVPT